MGVRLLILALMCLAFFFTGNFVGAVGASPTESVVLVLIDKVTWSELAEIRPLYLSRAARRGAVGIMSNKTASPYADSASAYLTIGTGQRSMAGPSGGLPVNAERAEQLSRMNQASPYKAKVGLLARRLRAAGLETTVIGNADIVNTVGRYEYGREVELIGMDSGGRVSTLTSRRMPFADGSINQRTVIAELDLALRRSGLIVIEIGDTRRADRGAAFDITEGPVSRKRRAILAADELIGAGLARLDLERDLLLIVSPSPPSSAGATERLALTPIIAVGGDFRAGTLFSPATRRTGLVTNLDVAPTIAAHLGAGWDQTTPGRVLRVEGGRRPFSEMAARARGYTMTGRISLPLMVFYALIVAFGLVSAVGFLAVSGRAARRLVGPARTALLAAVVFPLSILIAPLLPVGTESIWVHLAYVAALTALFVITLRTIDTARAVSIAAGVTILFLLGNILIGSPGDINSAFGYTAVTAARFYGIGNHYLAILFAAVIVASFLWFGEALEGRPKSTPAGQNWRTRPKAPDARLTKSEVRERMCHYVTEPRTRKTLQTGFWAAFLEGRRSTALAAAYGVIVLLVGHGSWGANTGGILMLAPALAVAHARIVTGRLEVKHLLYAGLAGGAALALLAGVDAWLPEEPAHIGVAARQVYDGGRAFNVLVLRKVQASLETFAYAFSLTVPIAGAVVIGAVMARRRGIRWSFAAFRHPAVRPALIVGLLGGGWGSLVNDSGVVVLAFAVAFLFPALLLIELGEAADSSD